MPSKPPPPRLPANRLKALRKLRASLLLVEHRIPMEHLVHVTLTFSRWTTDKEASEEFSAINRQFLRVFCGGYVRILAFTDTGVPHLHVLAIVNTDIRTGFDFAAYEKIRELSKKRHPSVAEKAEMQALGERLTTNETLKEIERQVKDIVRRRRKHQGGVHTFGRRLEICPVIKTVAKLRKYLNRNASETIEPSRSHKASKEPAEDSDNDDNILEWSEILDSCEDGVGWLPDYLTKGTRVISYGGDFPQVDFLPMTKGQIRSAEKLGVIFAGLKMPREYMKYRFRHLPIVGWSGKKIRQANWYFYIREFALPIIEACYTRDMRHWPVEEVGKIAYRALEDIDQWAKTGWPEEALRYMNAPSWSEMGYASWDDYIQDTFTTGMPSVSMPVPPVKKKRSRRA